MFFNIKYLKEFTDVFNAIFTSYLFIMVPVYFNGSGTKRSGGLQPLNI